MVSGGKDSVGKASILNKTSTRTTDKIKKKSSQTPAAKISSPNHLEEAAKCVIVDDESIHRLAIKDEDLEALRKSFEEGKAPGQLPSPLKSFAVKIPSPVQPKKVVHERTQKFVVAKVAPPDARLKPIDTAPCGPRYTKDGHIVPHSILGSVQDFVAEAMRRNEMEPDCPAAQTAFCGVGQLEVRDYKRPKTCPPKHIPTSLNQENALVNWRKRMAERKRVQGHISDLLEKPLDRLVMSQTLNSARQVREMRTAIDRATHMKKPLMEDERVLSEFWNQKICVGDPVNGLLTTLTKTEMGRPPVLEHIGKALNQLDETGESSLGDRPTVDARKTWTDSKYLKKRVRQLKPLLYEIDPIKPDMNYLEVIGTRDVDSSKVALHDSVPVFRSSLYTDIESTQRKSPVVDPLSEYPDVVDQPMTGPSLLFDGIPAYWNGSSDNNINEVGAVTRVNFECIAGNRTSTSIAVKNNGTTAIFYEWKKIPYKTPFESLRRDQVQRFYFNANEGHILPGDTLKISFIFKSALAGIFTETWEFLTTPPVMGGAALWVVLKGIAQLDDSEVVAERMKIEKRLAERDRNFAVEKIVNELMEGIRTPERPSSPLDQFKSDEEIFLEKNPNLHYHHEYVELLKKLHQQTLSSDYTTSSESSVSVVELLSRVLTVPDEEKWNELLPELNKLVAGLSSPPLRPNKNMLYNIAYSNILQMLDKVVSCSMMVRSTMGLPEVVMTDPITAPEIHEKKGKSKKVIPPKDVKEEKGKKGKSALKEPKEKETARPKSSSNKTKHSATTHSGGRDTAGEETRKHLPRTKTTPTPITVTPEDPLKPEIRKIYSEKIYGHVFSLVGDLIENVVTGFEGVNAKCTWSSF